MYPTSLQNATPFAVAHCVLLHPGAESHPHPARLHRSTTAGSDKTPCRLFNDGAPDLITL